MKETKELRANKGITLIALVITIIVMLILVGVTISMAVNGGLFDYAGKAVGDTKNVLDREQQLANGGIEVDGTWYNSIDEYLKGGTETVGDIEIKLTMVSTPIEITADGTYVDKIEEGVPIPKGFYYVGGTKDTGVVISDAKADENTTNTIVPDMLTGNQFVWVPVLQNQKLKIEIKSKDPITDIILDNLFYEKVEQNTLNEAKGKTNYNAEIIPELNGKYFLTVFTDNAVASKSIDIRSLYAYYPYQSAFELQTREEILIDYTGSASKDGCTKWLNEIAQQQGVDVQTLLESYFGEGTTIDNAWAKILDMVDHAYRQQNAWNYPKIVRTSVDSTLNSVNKYGGFYIARFEAGAENPRGEGASPEEEFYSKKNMYPYVYINRINAISKASMMYENRTNITTALSNGAVWGRTVNWLLETNAITEEQFRNSKNWGNYGDSYMHFTGKYYSTSWNETIIESTEPTDSCYLLGTGVTEQTRKNNIYDLAGNCQEWISENFDSINTSTPALVVGGNYDWDFDDFPYSSVLGHNQFGDYYSGPSTSFRVSLYIGL